MKKILFITFALMAFTLSTFAQVTASASASATILTPITITKDVDMNFGNLAVSASAGTVVLTPAGIRSEGGGVTFIPASPGTVTAASFTVTGLAGLTYSISLPTGNLTITDGTNNMIVNTFTSTPTPTGTLAGGSQILNVGATLEVGASQVAGTYTSTSEFDVTVNYN